MRRLPRSLASQRGLVKTPPLARRWTRRAIKTGFSQWTLEGLKARQTQVQAEADEIARLIISKWAARHERGRSRSSSRQPHAVLRAQNSLAGRGLFLSSYF